mgnify:CR=1 FL=1
MERITSFFSRRLALPDFSRFRATGPVKKSVTGGIIAAAILVALYYPVGMIMIHQINDDVTYSPPEAEIPKGGSFSAVHIFFKRLCALAFALAAMGFWFFPFPPLTPALELIRLGIFIGLALSALWLFAK